MNIQLKYFPGKFGNPGKSNSCPGSLSKGSILRRLQEKSGAMACMNVVAFKHVGMILGFVNLDRILLSESPIFRCENNKLIFSWIFFCFVPQNLKRSQWMMSILDIGVAKHIHPMTVRTPSMTTTFLERDHPTENYFFK
jgi:hypothetical protein